MRFPFLAALFLLTACPEDPDPIDPGPLVCDLVPADLDCPRRLVCCDDAATCWVETATDSIDCEADSCLAALDAACFGG